MKKGKHGGSGHSSSGTRGNSKIGTKTSPSSAGGPATNGGKSAKSATAYKC